MSINTTKGYFNSCPINFELLTSAEKEDFFTIKAPEGKDQMALLVTVTTGSPSTHQIAVFDINDTAKIVQLRDGNLNIIRIPSLGYVDSDGNIKILFVSGKDNVTAAGVAIGITNHIDVVNN